MKTQAEQTEIPIPLAGTKLTALQLALTRARDARIGLRNNGASEADVQAVGQLAPGWGTVFLRVRAAASIQSGAQWDELRLAAVHLQKEEAKEVERLRKQVEREKAKAEREAAASKRSDKAP